MKKLLGRLCLFCAMLGAIFAGWVDFNNDEPQAAVLVLLIITMLLGLIMPKKAWLWAIILALGLPIVYLVGRFLGYQPVSPPSPYWFASLLALIPAFIGVYVGALGRVILNQVITHSY